MTPASRRVRVVGTSGSGKTHFARRIAARLGVPHLELDALNHRANWEQSPLEEFQEELLAFVRSSDAVADGWVVCGNYRNRVQSITDADTYVWLDYSRALVTYRVVRRTLTRVVLRRELWNGNRERWRDLLTIDRHKNILVWSWTSYADNRRSYEAALRELSGATWVRLRSPKEADRWLASIV